MARVAIVDDHGLMAQTLSAALEASGATVRVVDPVTTEGDLAAAIRDGEPDLVLLDLDLGRRGAATDLLPGLVNHVPVVIVTGVQDPVRHARCVRAGAVGIVDKASSFSRLLDAVERALTDGTLLTKHEREEHLALLRDHDRARQEQFAPFQALTPREAEVLGALMRGDQVDDIAEAAVVSVSTVRTQVRAILTKLGVSSQLAAVAGARRVGWIPPQER